MRKMIALSALFVSAQAFAEEAANAAAAVHAAGGMGDKGLLALGVSLMLGLGVFGATSAQGRVGASAMDGLARNPQARNSMFVPMIVVLALIESLFILTWLIGSGIANKV